MYHDLHKKDIKQHNYFQCW